MKTDRISADELERYIALEDGLSAVRSERKRQHLMHGKQNLPDGLLKPLGRADAMRERCELAFGQNRGTWAHIFLEEVFEVIEAPDLDNLVEELVQVAAVCLAWREAIRGRG